MELAIELYESLMLAFTQPPFLDFGALEARALSIVSNTIGQGAHIQREAMLYIAAATKVCMVDLINCISINCNCVN